MSRFLRQQAPPDHEQNDVHHLKKSRNHEKAGGRDPWRDTIPADMTDNSNRVKWAFFESPKRSIQKTLIFPIDHT